MGSTTRFSLWCLLLLVVSPPLHAQAGKTIFCCEDEAGQRVCGDVLPQQCYGRAYRELSPQGVVRKEVAAPLTKAEIAALEAQAREKAEAEARALAQRRQDEALFEAYPTLESIDEREARSLEELDRSVAVVLAREQELLAQRKAYDEEMEFYRGRELPRELRNTLQAIDAELVSHKEFLDQKEAERAVIRERFNIDRVRYVELLESGFKRH